MNVVSLIGNLATDVELKAVGEGKQVAGFLLAIDRPSKDGGADFVHVSAWDRQGELCSQYLSKGKRVGIEGRLQPLVGRRGRQPPERARGGRPSRRVPPPPEGGAATDADIPFAAAAASG